MILGQLNDSFPLLAPTWSLNTQDQTHTHTHTEHETEMEHNQAECVPKMKRGECDLTPDSEVSVFWAVPWVWRYL